MISRDEALHLLKDKVKNRNYVKHMIAVEAIMRELAHKLGQDEELWAITGLLHDIDFEETSSNPKLHGIKACELLRGKLPEEALRAIKAHNYENTEVKPETLLDKALIASDAISGLLVACALVMPNKKMNEVKVETVIRKFKSKDFARGVKRERILLCEEIGLTKEEFFEIALQALKKIANQLGL